MVWGMSPVVTTTDPAAAIADWRSAAHALEHACPPDRAARSLDYLLNRLGSGAVRALSTTIGRERQTIRHWRQGNHPISAEMVWRIAAAYVADPMPGNARQLDELLSLPERARAAALPGHVELFNQFYSPDEKDAAIWLLQHRGDIDETRVA